MKKHWRLELFAIGALLVIAGIYLYDSHGDISNAKILNSFDDKTPLEIIRGSALKKQVIFTFDGGEGNQSAAAILDTLKSHGIRSTFFLTGMWVRKNPDLAKRMVAEGHEIFNHTFDHPHLTKLTPWKVIDELAGMSTELQKATGISSGPYFRPPYGDRNPKVLAAAAKAGYRSVYWTQDARDWQESQGMTADEVESRILSAVEPGTIYLMHLGDSITGKILDKVIVEIESRGYKIVSLTQGL